MLPDLPWFVYAMLLAPVGVILVAAIYKTMQVREARDWPDVEGKVISARAEVRQVKVMDGERADGHRFEERNFAGITYEYIVAGKTYRNNRVSIGEDRGNFEVAETLARYPVGKAVTVYYNPNRRSEAVLERDLPKGLWGCVGAIVAVAVVGVFGSAIGLHGLTQLASGHVANAPLTVALVAFGAAMMLIAFAIQRHAARARRWTVVPGVIATSDLDRFRGVRDDGRRGPVMYQARIGYTYSFNGTDYTGTVASLGGTMKSTSDWAVQAWAGRYRDGQAVEVYVNPDNPSESVLDPRTRGIGVMYGVAAVVWALAAFVATRG